MRLLAAFSIFLALLIPGLAQQPGTTEVINPLAPPGTNALYAVTFSRYHKGGALTGVPSLQLLNDVNFYPVARRDPWMEATLSNGTKYRLDATLTNWVQIPADVATLNGSATNLTVYGGDLVGLITADEIVADRVTINTDNLNDPDSAAAVKGFVKRMAPIAVNTIDELLAITTVPFSRHAFVLTNSIALQWVYCPDLEDPDNGVSVRRPDDITTDADPGRWQAVVLKDRVVSLPNMAALRAINPDIYDPGTLFQIAGYYGPRDGGFSTYSITNTISGTNALGGRILALGGTKSFELIPGDSVNTRQFGARGDGVTDDREAIQAAWNFRKGKTVFTPASLTPYMLGSTVYLTNSNPDRSMSFHGEGAADLRGGTIFMSMHSNAPVFLADGPGVDFKRFTIDWVIRPASTQTNAVGIQFRNCWNGWIKEVNIYDAGKAIWGEPGYGAFSLDLENISIYGYSVGGIHLQGVGTPAIVLRRVDIRQSGFPRSSTATASNSGTNVTVSGMTLEVASQLSTNQLVIVSGFSPPEYNGIHTCLAPNGTNGFQYILASPPSGPVTGVGTIENYYYETPLEAIRISDSQYVKLEDVCLEWFTGKRAAYFGEVIEINGFHLEGFNAKPGGNNAILQFAKGGEIHGMDMINASAPGGWVSSLFQVDSGKLTVDQIQYRDLKFDSPGSTLVLATGSGILPQPKLFNNGSRRWNRQSSPGPLVNPTIIEPNVTYQGSGWLYNLNGAHALGAASVDVDSGSGTLPIGSWVEIGSYTYRVAAFLPASGAITNIIVEPPLVQAASDNTPVKLRGGSLFLFRGNEDNLANVEVKPTPVDRKWVFEGGNLSVRRKSDDGERVMYLQATNSSQGLVVGTNAPGFQSFVVSVGSGDTQVQLESDTLNWYVGGGAVRKTGKLQQGADLIIGNGTDGTGLLVGGGGVSRLRHIFHTKNILSGGVATFSNSAVTTNSRIFISRASPNASSAIGVGFKYAIDPGVSYTVTSIRADTTTETADASTIDVLVINP